MRRYLPFLIIAAVLLLAVGGGLLLYSYRKEPEPAPPPPAPVATPSPTLPTPTATETPEPTVSATVAPPATETPGPTVSATVAPPATETPAPSASRTVAPREPTFTYGRPGAKPGHVRGDGKAPVVLEEFGDFECLPCSLVFPILEKLEHEYGDKLCVVFREHPLQMHRYARDAARAAEAAGLQGHFWEMHDTLYRNRTTWKTAAYIRPYLNDYAAELKLDVERFKADMEGEQVQQRIATDEDRGASLGIDRTPILFINGEKIPATDLNEKALRAAIDKALAAKQPPP